MKPSSSTHTQSGDGNEASQKTSGENVFYIKGQTNQWRNKHLKTIVVELIDTCEIRVAETKTVGVIYQINGKYCVRALAEFRHKFERVEENAP